eukprot:CAMPEP_0203813392 /NCGR_PEP_ID=MMETSP0115-20131106/4690_1 /ASSEMBLY_ACC=CAM_ASM_000227 /TAXON_ID=33651 /ORGANISM="Bicosoecid sp, Strain ms1" /LENGTH=612 /DNA_ID=CAMNT_0050722257 /DNA_START=23 /DNA_END=1861 /DNA_ORIENTATION=-
MGWEDEYPGFTPKLYERAQRAFKEADADGSGAVNTEELGEVLKGMGYEITEDELGMFIKQIDVNSDGRVSEAEFCKALHTRMHEAAKAGFMGGFKGWKFINWRKWAFWMKIVSTVMAIVNLILAIYAFSIFADSSAAVAELADTWEAKPVNGLSFVSFTGSCPTGYKEYNKNPYFAGVPDKCDCTDRVCPTSWYADHSGQCTAEEGSTGCTQTSTQTGDCGGSSSSSRSRSGANTRGLACTTTYNCDCTNRRCDKTITVGQCDSTETSQQCTDVPGWPAKEMPNWRGKKICTRFGGPSAVEREDKLDEDTMTCTDNWGAQGCASGTTNATVLCFPPDVDCPVTAAAYSPAGLGSFSVQTDITAFGLPTISVESATGTAGAWTSQGWDDGAKTFTNPALEFNDEYFQAFDSQLEADVYEDNGIPARYATAGQRRAIGYRRELGWKNDCIVSRRQIIRVIPEVDELKMLLTFMMILIICDFLWTVVETFTIADSLEFKHLAIRSVADILCYGANLPLVLLATGAGGAIANTIDDIAGCAPSASLTASFITVGEKARSLAGTNIIILILKGIKIIFMSALVQHGVYVAQVACCGRKQAQKDIEMAFKTKNPAFKA